MSCGSLTAGGCIQSEYSDIGLDGSWSYLQQTVAPHLRCNVLHVLTHCQACVNAPLQPLPCGTLRSPHTEIDSTHSRALVFATTVTIQCRGTTKKGERCKINTTDGFCHHHRPNQHAGLSPRVDHRPNNKPKQQHARPERLTNAIPLKYSQSPSRSPSPSKIKPGYIYVYTLTSLMNGTKNSLSVRNLPGTSRFKKDKWSDFDARKLKYILIKVGMTTGSVSGRLSQWELQCRHQLTCLVPGTKIKMSLLESIRKLSLSSPSYKSFDKHGTGFYCSKAVQQAETQIHTLLHRKYGSGDVFCSGCAKTGSNYSIHVEWFLIPKSDLNTVFGIIDSVCKCYN